MSTAIRHDGVRTIYVSAAAGGQEEVAAFLRQDGYSDVIRVGDGAALGQVLEMVQADLVIADLTHDAEAICQVLHHVRRDCRNINQFVISLALIDDPSRDNVLRAVNAGVDDILVFPLTAPVLEEHLLAVATNRRPFVIAWNYIGPDRRQQSRPGQNNGCLVAVPNPVYLKQTRNLSEAAVAEKIRQAQVQIAYYKGACHVTQICYLRDQIIRGLLNRGDMAAIREHVDMLAGEVATMSSHIRGSALDHLQPYLHSLGELISGQGDALFQATSQTLHLLKKLTDVLSRQVELSKPPQ